MSSEVVESPLILFTSLLQSTEHNRRDEKEIKSRAQPRRQSGCILRSMYYRVINYYSTYSVHASSRLTGSVLGYQQRKQETAYTLSPPDGTVPWCECSCLLYTGDAYLYSVLWKKQPFHLSYTHFSSEYSILSSILPRLHLVLAVNRSLCSLRPVRTHARQQRSAHLRHIQSPECRATN